MAAGRVRIVDRNPGFLAGRGLPAALQGMSLGRPAAVRRHNRRVKRARPPGAPPSRRCLRKVRTAQGGVAANGCPPRGEDQSNRDESMRRPQGGRIGETGNLYAQQYQIGRRGASGLARPSRRVGSTEPGSDARPRGMAATGGRMQGGAPAQNPAYRPASLFRNLRRRGGRPSTRSTSRRDVLPPHRDEARPRCIRQRAVVAGRRVGQQPIAG